MDLGLKGKHALITGGSKGIGRAAANALADEGCDLTLVARDANALDETAAAIRGRRQVRVATIAADLSSDRAVRDVAATVEGVDILVNNAGAIPPGSLREVDDETWRRAWDLKVFGFISLSRAVYAKMAARKSGVIVNIIGRAGQAPSPRYIVGASGNAALMAFTRALGMGSAADGIRVVGINPGAIATERMQMLHRAEAEKVFGDASRWRELSKDLPFGRPGRPEEIASAVAFLASPVSSYTNATILSIDGGLG